MRFIAVLLMLIALAGAGLWFLLNSFNHFDAVTREFAGRCAPVTGVAGPEDIVIDRGRGIAFISSLDRRDPEARGAIHVVDPADPLAQGAWRDITGGEPADFKPLGLSYYEDENVRRLFVVNAATNSVELYDLAEDGMLFHRETLTERRLTSPNNIVAVGPRQFYVSNDVRAGRENVSGQLRFLFRASDGEVFHFNGVAWRIAATDLQYANGVAISPDGGELYVAETASGALRTYARDAETGALTELRRTIMPHAPDNISVAEDGALYVAGLPKPLTTPRHGADASILAPSAVMRVADGTVETIYLDDGSELSLATVAAPVGRSMLLGALYENKFLICDLPRN